MREESPTTRTEAWGSNMASFLGWFSVGLGVAEVMAPGWIAQTSGLPDDEDTEQTLQLYGIREIASGLAVLTPGTTKPGLWSRVAGDVLDLATLGRNHSKEGADSKRLNVATAAVLGVTALDIFCALSQKNEQASRAPIEVSETISVNESPEVLYRFWRDLSNLPSVMTYLDSVHEIDERRSHWVATIPGGRRIKWNAEITSDQPGKRISWRSTEGSDIFHEGAINFIPLPGNRGTAIHVDTRVGAGGVNNAGLMGKFLSKVAEHKLSHDLRRFKQVMEAGEITTTRGQPAGRRSSETWLDMIARV